MSIPILWQIVSNVGKIILRIWVAGSDYAQALVLISLMTITFATLINNYILLLILLAIF